MRARTCVCVSVGACIQYDVSLSITFSGTYSFKPTNFLLFDHSPCVSIIQIPYIYEYFITHARAHMHKYKGSLPV